MLRGKQERETNTADVPSSQYSIKNSPGAHLFGHIRQEQCSCCHWPDPEPTSRSGRPLSGASQAIFGSRPQNGSAYSAQWPGAAPGRPSRFVVSFFGNTHLASHDERRVKLFVNNEQQTASLFPLLSLPQVGLLFSPYNIFSYPTNIIVI